MPKVMKGSFWAAAEIVVRIGSTTKGPWLDSSIPEDPPVAFLHEEGNILNIPKDAPLLSDGERGTVSTNVRTVLEGEHTVTKGCLNYR